MWSNTLNHVEWIFPDKSITQDKECWVRCVRSGNIHKMWYNTSDQGTLWYVYLFLPIKISLKLKHVGISMLRYVCRSNVIIILPDSMLWVDFFFFCVLLELRKRRDMDTELFHASSMVQDAVFFCRKTWKTEVFFCRYTIKTHIRLFSNELSDQGLDCLLIPWHHSDPLSDSKTFG